MANSKPHNTDHLTVILLVIGLLLFAAGVIVALTAGSIGALNVSCGLVLTGLFVSIAGGLNRQRHEQAARELRRQDTLAH